MNQFTYYNTFLINAIYSQLGKQWTKIILKCLQDWGIKKDEINFK